MFAAAAKENAREPLAGSDRDQHRRLDCFNDFVGAAGCISPAGTDNNEIVFFGGGFAEYLGSRLTRLDRGLELDAGSSQNVSLLIESPSERLFVTRTFRDAQERDPGLGRAGQYTAQPRGVLRGARGRTAKDEPPHVRPPNME